MCSSRPATADDLHQCACVSRSGRLDSVCRGAAQRAGLVRFISTPDKLFHLWPTLMFCSPGWILPLSLSRRLYPSLSLSLSRCTLWMTLPYLAVFLSLGTCRFLFLSANAPVSLVSLRCASRPVRKRTTGLHRILDTGFLHNVLWELISGCLATCATVYLQYILDPLANTKKKKRSPGPPPA